eukprot:g2312.t1
MKIEPRHWRGWLESLDDDGFLVQYHENLATKLDSVVQIIDVYAKDGEVDRQFFKDAGIKKLGHQRLFEKWFREPCLKVEVPLTKADAPFLLLLADVGFTPGAKLSVNLNATAPGGVFLLLSAAQFHDWLRHHTRPDGNLTAYFASQWREPLGLSRRLNARTRDPFGGTRAEAAAQRLHEAYLRKRNTYEAEKEELALIDANLSSAVHELRCCGRETEQRHNELCQRQSMMDAAEAESSRMEPASLMAQGLLDALRPEGTRADGDAVQRMVDALQEEGMEASLAAVAPEVLQKAPSGRQGFELKAEEHLRKFARELHGRILDDQRVALEHAKSAMKNASKAEQQAAERVDGIKKTYEDQKDKLNILREAMIEAEEEALCFDGLLEQDTQEGEAPERLRYSRVNSTGDSNAS